MFFCLSSYPKIFIFRDKRSMSPADITHTPPDLISLGQEVGHQQTSLSVKLIVEWLRSSLEFPLLIFSSGYFTSSHTLVVISLGTWWSHSYCFLLLHVLPQRFFSLIFSLYPTQCPKCSIPYVSRCKTLHNFKINCHPHMPVVVARTSSTPRTILFLSICVFTCL